MEFTIKGLKEWRTHDGGGYQFTLLLDGKKIAFIHNDGNGGEIDIQECTKENREILTDYCLTLPKIKSYFSNEMVNVSVDIFLAGLVDSTVNAKRIASDRKKGLLFKLNTDTADISYRILNFPKSNQPHNFLVLDGIQYLIKKYGKDNFKVV